MENGDDIDDISFFFAPNFDDSVLSAEENNPPPS